MKTHCKLAATLLLLSTLNFQLSTARAQGTAFTYQGRLNDGAAAASGSYDLRFTLYDAVSGGAVQSGPLLNVATTVSNGLFTVALDFGAGVFNGNKRWLEIGVRTNGGTTFASLSPRQPITPTPYAVTAGSVTGGVPDPQIPVTIPRLSLGNTFTAPQTFSGTAQSMLNLSSSHTGGTWLNLGNSDAGGKTWNLISSATANGEGPGKLLFREASYGVVLTLSSNGNVGIGTTSPGNPLDVTVAGTTNGGVAGFPEVVAHFRRSPGFHSAISLDSAANQDGVLYFSEGGSPIWGVRHDSQPEHDFQLRYHAGGANIAMWTVKTNGNVGIGTATPTARLDVSGTIRAGGGIVFPDGSVQVRSADSTPRVTSGLPAGSTFTVNFNGTSAALVGYEEEYPVNLDTSDGFVYQPSGQGRLSTNGLIIRRLRSAETNWSQWANVFRAADYPVTMTLAIPGGSSLIWTGVTHIQSYSLTSDNSGTVEELSLRSPSVFVRTRTGSPTVVAPSTPMVGAQFWVTNALQQGIAILPGLEFAFPYDPNGNATGGRLYNTLLLRANPVSGELLHQVMTARSSLPSLAVRQSGTAVVSANSAAVSAYKLTLADDGLPIEEYKVHFSTP